MTRRRRRCLRPFWICWHHLTSITFGMRNCWLNRYPLTCSPITAYVSGPFERKSPARTPWWAASIGTRTSYAVSTSSPSTRSTAFAMRSTVASSPLPKRSKCSYLYVSLSFLHCHFPLSVKTGAPHDLYETDKKWALSFVPNGTAQVSLPSLSLLIPLFIDEVSASAVLPLFMN